MVREGQERLLDSDNEHKASFIIFVSQYGYCGCICTPQIRIFPFSFKSYIFIIRAAWGSVAYCDPCDQKTNSKKYLKKPDVSFTIAPLHLSTSTSPSHHCVSLLLLHHRTIASLYSLCFSKTRLPLYILYISDYYTHTHIFSLTLFKKKQHQLHRYINNSTANSDSDEHLPP